MLTAIFLLAGSYLDYAKGQLPHCQFRYYASNEGFLGIKVRNIFQDKEGFIWIAASNGLYLYDGQHFSNFNSQYHFPDNFNNYEISVND